MAGPSPSALFERLANAWRDLAFRSDIDDIILELLGRFSLEKIYAESGDTEEYQQLVLSLIAQLNVIFYIQRLTLPVDNIHMGRHLSLFVSWEVTIRSVEFVLQVVTDGREGLWGYRRLRDKYLAEFLLSALRILIVHPRAVNNQRARDRRDRFARIHKSLEQIFDSYPGPKSFLLTVCKEVTQQLQDEPDSLGLPQRMKYELPNLTSELYPLEGCLSPAYILELVHKDDSPSSWLFQYLALRDIVQFVVAASIQYNVNQEYRDVRLQSSSARSRNAVLQAVENMRLPSNFSKADLVVSFSAQFRIILPDTLDAATREKADLAIDELEIDALDSLCTRLSERQIIHRASDGEVIHGISQVVSDIMHVDNPSSQYGSNQPSLYVLNCPECHMVGGSELKTIDINFSLPQSTLAGSKHSLPPDSVCFHCGQPVSMAREVPLIRNTWDLLQPLETEADAVSVERHLPSQFMISAPKADSDEPLTPGTGNNTFGSGSHFPRHGSQTSFHQRKLTLPDQGPVDYLPPISQVISSPVSPLSPYITDTLRTDNLHTDSSTFLGTSDSGRTQSPTLALSSSYTQSSSDRRVHTNIRHDMIARRRSEAAAEKGRSRWKFSFGSMRRAPPPASGDSSSLSSTGAENQRLEEFSLGGLMGGSKSARGKNAKTMNAYLSQNSTLAIFWAYTSIQIWDVGTSPPTVTRGITSESTCILAAVAKSHAAYIVGTRDQKLTLRIANLTQPSSPMVEYRMPSSQWCRSIAIDRNENYVVVGFDNATVRFFKTTQMEAPRTDRLHGLIHTECRNCPSVDTLSFSSDGLALLASTRSPKTGVIQLYMWSFPFLSCQELTSCRYPVPLHESEDNGVSGAIIRSGGDGEDDVICITTWTQSGTPVLVQPQSGHRTLIKSEASPRQGRLGSRIQCAAFSPSGRDIAMVNDKGHLYQISHNANPMEIRRIATSKELTVKTSAFDMGFMNINDEEHLVLVWFDTIKATGWIKKVSFASRANNPDALSAIYHDPSTEPTSRLCIDEEPPNDPVELPTQEHAATELEATGARPTSPAESLKSPSRKFQGFFQNS